MMKIEENQLRELEFDARRKFEARVHDHLRARFSDYLGGLQEKDLRTLVHIGVDKARSYGIETENEVQRFIEFMAILGEDFDIDEKYRWSRPILSSDDMNAVTKVNKINEHVVFET